MKKLLIIGFVWPEPNSTAAGSRMLQLINAFLNNKYAITFVSTALKTEKSFDLEKLNIDCYNIQLNNSEFDLLLKKINPTVVMFDRYLTEEQFCWRIEEICPNALRILDTEDLHFLRNARLNAFKKNVEVSKELLINEITKREIASIYRCDLTLIISEYEFDILTNVFKVNNSILLYIPFMLKNLSEEQLNSYPTFNQRTNFMTIGNFKHQPNWMAVLYLKETIWPLIKEKIPEAKISIYGAYSSKKVEQLHNVNDGFLIKGWINSTKEAFINSKVCLAPLQFGAGLKGKLIDAMNYGTPSVTTTLGAEGMHNKLDWNGFIENNPKKFAAKAVELYQKKIIWEKSQKNGIKIINKCFDKNTFEIKFINKIDELNNNLNSHRFHNFIGSMLRHHTLKSTKYLSKWIEEKNKINF